MDETQDIIKTFYSMAAPEVQARINDPEWKNEVIKIGTRYGLNTDQQENLKLEVLLALLALQNPDSLAKNIEQEVVVNSDIAQRIRTDIDQTVFKELKAVIYKTMSEIDASEFPTKIQTPQPNLNRIAEVKKVAPAPENLPTNLPMIEEERELVVQKNPPMQAPIIKPGMPKTFGESVKPVQQTSTTPTPAKPSVIPPKPTTSSPDQFFVSRPKQPARSIVEAKLAGSFNMPQEKMNVSAPNPSGKKIDPYREPIE